MLSIQEITEEQIDRWCQQHEGPGLEFKEAKNNVNREEMSRSCCALANTGGGYVVLGVSDAFPHQVTGTRAGANLSKTVERISSKLSPAVPIQATEVKHREGAVVVFIVGKRPKGSPVEYQRQALIRIGQQIQPMSVSEIAEVLAETKPHWLEGPCCSNLSPQEVRQLLEIERFYELQKKEQPAQLSMVMNDLIAMNMIAPAGGDSYTINRMGVLLLARSISACDPHLALKRMRVLRFKSIGDTQTFGFDETFDRGYATGFDDLVQMVVSQLDNEHLVKGSLRQYDEFVPEVAVRELTANALIHQDFLATGHQLWVRIYTNRMIVSNPGKPLVDIDRMIDGHKTRNEIMMNAMRTLGICERASTGIDKALAAMEKVYGAPISYKTGDQDMTEAIVLATRSYAKLSPGMKLLACYQHCALRSLNYMTMTNASFRNRFGLDASKREDVSRLFKKLVDKKFIKRSIHGHSNKYASYVPHWFDENEDKILTVTKAATD